MADKKEVRVELLCTGAFQSTKGSVVYEFHKVTGPNTYDAESMSWKKLRGTPGVVYTVATASLEAFNEKGSIFTDTLRYDRPWGNEAQRLEWQEHAKAVETAVAMDKQREREESTLQELRNMMKPLRSLYQRTNQQGRAALIANVVLELQRRSIDD